MARTTRWTLLPRGIRRWTDPRRECGELAIVWRGALRNFGPWIGEPDGDILELPDGSFLVSDDRAGAIYRVWYSGG